MLSLSEVRERLRRAQARRFYRAFVPRGGLCFDVGANVGDRTELFLALGARVVAIEPQALCRRRLRERFGSRVTIVGDALGSVEGTAELLVASYHTLSACPPSGRLRCVRAVASPASSGIAASPFA